MYKSRHLAVELLSMLNEAGPAGVGYAVLRSRLFASVERKRYYETEEQEDRYLRSVLDDMKGAGVLESAGDAEDQHWRLNRRWPQGGEWREQPPRPPTDDNPPRDGNDGDGAGGLREVLGHHLLFALPADEFDAAIARAVGEA
jgi:hypothetical protein